LNGYYEISKRKFEAARSCRREDLGASRLATRSQDGKRVEGTPFVVGLVRDFLTKSSAKQRVVELGLLEKINSPQQTARLSFRQIADRYMHPELGELHDLGQGTQETFEGNIQHCIARWGDTPALDIRVLEVESWLKSLAKDNRGKYQWSTVGKIRDAMSVVYQHAQRHEMMPAGVEHNPARARKLGGPKIRTKSGYKAVRVSPAQIKKMLAVLPLLQRTMVILCSLTAIPFLNAWDFDGPRSLGWRKRFISGSDGGEAILENRRHPHLIVTLH
jgi:hypothetical protein